MNSPWHIHLLGALRARRGEQDITRFRSQKYGALLAYLALFRARAHPREELADLLWPDADMDVGRVNLRTALASLRRQLEPPGIPSGSVIVADGHHSVRLDARAAVTDVAEFEDALKQAERSSDPPEQMRLLSRAVQAYAGPLLPGFYETWALTERDRLAEAYLRALRQLSACFEQAGDLDQALDHARRAVSADPLREESHADVMRLLAAAGQPQAALRQYRELSRLLDEELADEPSAEVRKLAAQIERQQTARPVPPPMAVGAAPAGAPTPTTAPAPSPPAAAPSEGGAAAASAPAPVSPPTNLPLMFTRFFGREDEVTALEQALRSGDGRLVTITGPGGGGKTRLAIETARRLQDGFPGGIWFVPLADLQQPERIPDAVAAGLGAAASAPAGGALERVVRALSGPPALLILDNYEHLVEEGAAFVQVLRERVPALTCLVTSRQRLLLDGEREFPLLPLATPSLPGTPERLLEFPSVQLFVDRARAIRPDFQITRRNAAALAALCGKLEGIPLAVELAAAWAQTLTPTQMLERLNRRFDLLVSRRRDLSPRHQTLRATIEWSYRLLAPDVQRFFARLSAFRGGWTLEAAETVCGEPTAFAYLAELQERSLVVAEEQREGYPEAVMRCRMLETLREFAGEQVGDAERADLCARHADFFRDLAERAEPELTGPEQGRWLDRLEAERDNLRAALAWCSEAGNVEAGLRMGSALWRFWWARGPLSEGRALLENLLRQAGEAAVDDAVHARGLHAAGSMALNDGDLTSARFLFEAAIRLRRELGDADGLASSLYSMGLTLDDGPGREAARPFFEESLALRRRIDDKLGMAACISGLASLSMKDGDFAAARARFEEGLALRREMGDTPGTVYILNSLAQVAFGQGDLAESGALLEESLTLVRAMGHRQGTAIILSNLGGLNSRLGDHAAARAHLAESLTLLRQLGDKRFVMGALENCALLEHGLGRGARAVRLWAAAEAQRDALGVPYPNDPEELETIVADVRAAIGGREFASAWNEGRRMSREEALAYALEQESEQEAPQPEAAAAR